MYSFIAIQCIAAIEVTLLCQASGMIKAQELCFTLQETEEQSAQQLATISLSAALAACAEK